MAVRGSVADSLVRLFGEQHAAFTGLQEEQLIEKIATRVVAQLNTRLKPQAHEESRYVRDIEAAAFLGVSVFTLRSWRSRGSTSGFLPLCAKVNIFRDHDSAKILLCLVVQDEKSTTLGVALGENRWRTTTVVNIRSELSAGTELKN